jgi:uncharacterized protein YprB with RNaseH-like and TPR domain
MKTYIHETKLKRYTGKAFDLYFGGLKPAVFDIETTGLSPSQDKVILTGILLISGGTARTIQFFAESPEDEKEVIKNTIATLKQADLAITYNGKSFDFPFIAKRAEKSGAGTFPDIYNLDLYTIIRNYSDLGTLLDSLSQKSIENYLGISDIRKDRISGAQSIRHYEHFVMTGSFNDERRIILHNRDDILQLYRLLPVLRSCDLHKALYACGYPAGRIHVDSCRLSRAELTVKAHATKKIKDYIAFPCPDLPCRIAASSKTGLLEIDFPAECIADKVFVIDALKLLNGALNMILKSDTEPVDEAGFPLPPYPAFQSGYLILKQNHKINFLEINTFLICFIKILESALTIQ